MNVKLEMQLEVKQKLGITLFLVNGVSFLLGTFWSKWQRKKSKMKEGKKYQRTNLSREEKNKE